MFYLKLALIYLPINIFTLETKKSYKQHSGYCFALI